MGKRRWLAAGSSLLAAAIGLLGAATAASASTASPVVGYTYIDGNTATANTIDGFARHADGSVTPLPGSPFAAAARAWARAWLPRGRSRPRRTAGTCWRPTPAATRSRSCASPRAACRCSPASPCPPAACSR
jgi:hypothetical protein